MIKWVRSIYEIDCDDYDEIDTDYGMDDNFEMNDDYEKDGNCEMDDDGDKMRRKYFRNWLRWLWLNIQCVIMKWMIIVKSMMIMK